MSQELLRLIIALLATLLLGREARRAARGSRRRQAFLLGAAGFGVITLANGGVTFGLASPALLTVLVGVGLALLLGSLTALVLAYRAGELREQFRRASDYVAAARDRAEGDGRERDEEVGKGRGP
jgi:hypothetical protein